MNPFRTLRRAFICVLLAALAVQPGLAREITILCGSHRDRLQEEIHLHRRAVAQRAGRGGGIGLLSAGAGEKRRATRVVEGIVLMEDADGVVSRRNDFDLDGLTVRFVPSAAQARRYQFAVSEGGYDEAAAAGGELLDLGDDDAREVRLPFTFPFFGQAYTSVFVHSDGNVTFGAPDAASTPRSLDRLVSGPPRVAPLFRDLDPSQSSDGIHFVSEPARAVISWVQVPEFATVGTGKLQTFQLRLYPDGRIEFAYNGITTVSAVVGIAPGGVAGPTRVVSFSQGSDEEFEGTVAERFTRREEVDIVRASQKFFEENDDAYDYLAFFNNLGIDADLGTVAFEITVRNRRQGIGDDVVDHGAAFGSPRRLQAVMNFGPLSQYPDNPYARLPQRFTSGDTTLTVLGHETGHLFLAFVSVRDPFDPEARPMLKRDRAHWNFVFNSEASLLEGNRICDRERQSCPPDLSGNHRFVTTGAVEGFSPLDQYLMGLRPPWEVPDTFLVENSTIVQFNRIPEVGVNFDGDRRDIRIDEIIAAEGRRIPDYSVAQRRFRIAFVLIHAAGVEPSQADIDKLNRFRLEFEKFYRAATGGRAEAITSVRRALHLSAFPATGVLLGAEAPAKVWIEDPAAADLEVLLSSASGGVGLPASVTIPAGSTSAEFVLRGLREGVDTITARIPGDEFEEPEARVEVLDGPAGLRLEAVSGDRQVNPGGQPLPDPVVVQVLDANNVPYAGIRIVAEPSAEGTVTPVEALTDTAGKAEFRWTPPASPGGTLSLRIAGAPDVPPLLVTTTGEPAFPAEGVVNAASFRAPIAAGALATVFGVNLAAGAEAQARSAPLPEELEGVQVLLNGLPVPLVYVSDRQINFYVPPLTQAGTASLAVVTPVGRTAPLAVEVVSVAPGIFSMPATGEGAVLLAGTGRLTSQQPAAPGDYLEIYCTGLGPVEPAGGGSPLRRTVNDPEVTIGGIPVSEIPFSGLAPGFVGLYQVNVQVPPGVASGPQPLRMKVAGVEANEVIVFIR